MGNKKFALKYGAILAEAGITKEGGGCDRNVGNLLYHMTGKFPANALPHRAFVAQRVRGGELANKQQLDGCFAFFKKVGAEAFDEAAYKVASGVGIVVAPEDIAAAFETLMAAERTKLEEQRYRVVGPLLGKFRMVGNMKWADQRALKETFDAKVLEILGPKTEADSAAGQKKTKKAKDKAAKESEQVSALTTSTRSSYMPTQLPLPIALPDEKLGREHRH